MEILTARQMQAADQHAIEELGIPGMELMEQAGRALFKTLKHGPVLSRVNSDSPITVLCGPGNNGGDGFVLARLCRQDGIPVRVARIPALKPAKGDAAIAQERWIEAGGETKEIKSSSEINSWLTEQDSAVYFDAILGTGSKGPVYGLIKDTLHQLQGLSAFKIAVDIPSGLDADSGKVEGEAFMADETWTLARPKLGLFLLDGPKHSGKLCVLDIGIPEASIQTTGPHWNLLDEDSITPLLPERNPEAHKGQQGRCLVIGGGPQMLGAPILAAKAALRAGVGLMDAVTAASAEGWLEALPEAMVLSPDLISADDLAQRYHSVVCGPGALHFEPMESWIKNVLASNVPTVFDASALDCFSLSSKNRSGSISPPLKPQHVCTPHPGEAARILDCSTQEVESDRVAALNALIERLQCTVVLKGAHTLIGNCEGQRALSPFRNAVLAVPGSGDVLAGMIGAYLARGLSAFPAACLGVYLHARTGETWAARKGTVEGMLASDLADLLPEVVGQLELAERTHES